MRQALKQKRGVAINPMRACAPVGAIMGTMGVHGAVAIVHGSQGCATYPRHQLARHFREPVEVATTSLTERTTVYGGRENLLAALRNVYLRCNPSMITVMSTCLSETIGDDIPGIIQEFQELNPEIRVPIISVKTPSYVGTHITGLDNFLTEIVTRFPKKSKPNNRLNIIPGWVNPGDIRELKAMLRKMGVSPLFITDYSDPLDGGVYLPKPRHPRGGTTLEELKDSANSLGTIGIQKHVGGKAAEILGRRHGLATKVLPMPIGIENTDIFLQSVSEITGRDVSGELRDERARLLDAIVDAHMFLTGLKAAIFGDPDMVSGLVRFCAELGLEPSFALTSFDSHKWSAELLTIAEEMSLDLEILVKSDLHELHKKLRENPVDILIGSSKGKFISRAENIPLVRVGFPIEDRFGYHRRAIVGYRGGIYLVDEIVNSYLGNGKASHRDVVSNTLLEEQNG
jgi:nitrogenase molybdenum-iron protein beta chain